MSTQLTNSRVLGYESTINNPRVSGEAEKHAQKVLAGQAAPNRLGPGIFAENDDLHGL